MSRQRIWQKKQRSLGRCVICAAPCKPYAKCDFHRQQEREKSHEKYLRRKIRKQLAH